MLLLLGRRSSRLRAGSRASNLFLLLACAVAAVSVVSGLPQRSIRWASSDGSVLEHTGPLADAPSVPLGAWALDTWFKVESSSDTEFPASQTLSIAFFDLTSISSHSLRVHLDVLDWGSDVVAATASLLVTGNGGTCSFPFNLVGFRDTWHHITLSWDGSNLKAFRRGTGLLGTIGAGTLCTDSAGQLALGSASLTGEGVMLVGPSLFGGVPFTMHLDELRLWTRNVPLSEAVVFGTATLSDADTIMPASVLAYYSFDDGSIQDGSGNSNDLSGANVNADADTPFQADSGMSTLQAAQSDLHIEQFRQGQLVVQLYDRFGNTIPTGGDVVTIAVDPIGGGGNDTTSFNVTDLGDGSYTAIVSMLDPGLYDVVVTVYDPLSGVGFVDTSGQALRVDRSCTAGSTLAFDSPTAPCDLCAPGTFKPAAGAAACQSCGDAKANSQSIAPGAVSVSQCLCTAGFYQTADSNACTSCPANAHCIGGNRLQAAQGYFQSPSDPAVMLRCVPADACSGGNQCSTGYNGFMCGGCGASHYRLNDRCEACSNNAVIWLAAMVAVSALLVSLLLRLGAGAQRFGVWSVGISFFQVLALFPIFDLRWPRALLYMFDVLSPLLFNIDVFAFEYALLILCLFAASALSPTHTLCRCLIPSLTSLQLLAMQMAFPIVVGAVMMAMYAVVSSSNHVYKWYSLRSFDHRTQLYSFTVPTSAAPGDVDGVGTAAAAVYPALDPVDMPVPTAGGVIQLVVPGVPAGHTAVASGVSSTTVSAVPPPPPRPMRVSVSSDPWEGEVPPPPPAGSPPGSTDVTPRKQRAESEPPPPPPLLLATLTHRTSVATLIDDVSLPSWALETTLSPAEELAADASTYDVHASDNLLIKSVARLATMTGFAALSRNPAAFRARCSQAYLQFLTIAYVYLARAALDMFNCTQQIDATFTLVSQPSIQCFGDEWWSFFALSFAGIVVYAIGIPAYLATCLYSVRSTLDTDATKQRYGSLYDRFRHDYWMWELVVMARKFLLILTVVFLATNFTLAQLFVGMGVLIGSLALQIRYNPYWTSTLNMLETTSLLSLIAILASGMFFWTGLVARDPAVDSASFALVVVAFALVFGNTGAMVYGGRQQIKEMRANPMQRLGSTGSDYRGLVWT